MRSDAVAWLRVVGLAGDASDPMARGSGLHSLSAEPRSGRGWGRVAGRARGPIGERLGCQSWLAVQRLAA